MEVILKVIEHDAKPMAFPNGWTETFYHCPICELQIGRTCNTPSYRFGHSTILNNNIFPKFCPKCGTALDYINSGLETEDILTWK